MSWDDAVEAFKTSLPNYEERLSQSALAHEMEEAFIVSEPLLGQAPPGTGKSYPAIVVLMDAARASGYPGVVSTATKALQDQYIADCNQIKENVFPDFRFMVLKGRSNYLCRSKMDKADEVLLDLPKTIDEINRIGEQDDVIGDIERLGFELTSTQKRSLTTTTDECPGKKTCKFGSTCFAEAAKAKAEQAHVIVVNHALLAVDATLRVRTQGAVSILPLYPNLVVDEAHELRGYVENALSTSITKRGLVNLISEVSNFTDDLELIPAGRMVVDPLFRKLDDVLGKPKFKGITEPVELTPAIVAELSPWLVKVYEFLQEMEGKVALVRASGDDDVERKSRVKKKVQTMTEKLVKVMVDNFAETVRWLERDRPDYTGAQSPLQLCTSPLDVAPFLAEGLWADTDAIMISATLAIGDDFKYMAHEHGIDLMGTYRTFDCPSPFDFKTQAITYIPEGMPDLRNSPAAHLAAFNMHNLELIKAAGGRSMLLFTAWSALDESYAELAPQLRDMGLTVFKQGELGSSRALADAFRDDETSVLFATKSFFTGVNIEGNSLLYLAIHKLPYHFPDVLWKARCSALDSSLPERERYARGAFSKLQIPDMTMTLIQGFGRLIRNMTDRGVVGIFDPSLAVRGGKKYGSKVRSNLPPAPVVDNLREAVAKLSALRVEIENMEP